MPTSAKTGQLQIRITPAQKSAIRSAARQAGLGISAYVLARVLPASASRFQQLTRELADADAEPTNARFALAELNSWLTGLGGGELREAVASPPPRMTPFLANYVAAMVEDACAQKGVAAPAWGRTVAPLVEPVFGSALLSLRLYLLTHSPAPFRRRNIFIDASVGSRV